MERIDAPWLTVITVTLNPGALLERTMESIASQSSQNIEVIVKDGGSTGLTWVPNDNRFRLIRSKDAGIYDAMNQALALARGRFVHFLNAGDQYHSARSLERVASACESFPPVGIVYGDYENRRHQTITSLPDRLTPAFLFRRPPCHQASFVRRDLLQAHGGFDTRFKFVADSDLFVRLVLQDKTPYRHVAEPVVVYQDGGVTAQLSASHQIDREFSQLRARYFSFQQRLMLGAVDALTLRRLRRRIVADDTFLFLRPAYFLATRPFSQTRPVCRPAEQPKTTLDR
jgi:glycosyltransferase involved in cell wall biosynthesis